MRQKLAIDGVVGIREGARHSLAERIRVCGAEASRIGGGTSGWRRIQRGVAGASGGNYAPVSITPLKKHAFLN